MAPDYILRTYDAKRSACKKLNIIYNIKNKSHNTKQFKTSHLSVIHHNRKAMIGLLVSD